MTVLIGTSGWQYADWRGRFYPRGLPQARWFEHLLTGFRTVELNVSFYRLPRAEVFAGWRDRSPADAVLAVKASRYLTHVRRLRDPAEPVARLLSRARELRGKLGPVLVQLPPDLPADPRALASTLSCFDGQARVAVEPRHASWWDDAVRTVLEAHGAALVWADRRGEALGPLWRTADWGYVRLHEGDAELAPFYRRETLRRWAQAVAAHDNVFVYFNNDPGCAAVANAVTFAEEARGLGLDVTRVPAHPDVVYRDEACGGPS